MFTDFGFLLKCTSVVLRSRKKAAMQTTYRAVQGGGHATMFVSCFKNCKFSEKAVTGETQRFLGLPKSHNIAM